MLSSLASFFLLISLLIGLESFSSLMILFFNSRFSLRSGFTANLISRRANRWISSRNVASILPIDHLL